MYTGDIERDRCTGGFKSACIPHIRCQEFYTLFGACQRKGVNTGVLSSCKLYQYRPTLIRSPGISGRSVALSSADERFDLFLLLCGQLVLFCERSRQFFGVSFRRPDQLKCAFPQIRLRAYCRGKIEAVKVTSHRPGRYRPQSLRSPLIEPRPLWVGISFQFRDDSGTGRQASYLALMFAVSFSYSCERPPHINILTRTFHGTTDL